MSSISGIFYKRGKKRECPIDIMTSSMRHRGAHCSGQYSNSNISLSHNKLNVANLSSECKQPTTSNSGKHVLMLDGYINNFSELAAQYNLELKTETEVILNLFELKGENFVNELNGMFAMAIYDIENNILYLFRDRLGIKPLFYYENSDLLIFGSELKSIVSLPMIAENLRINNDAVCHYLHLCYTPGPGTIYEDIYKFAQGSMMKISSNGTEKKYWWKLDEQSITSSIVSDEGEALEQMEELLNESVRRNLTGVASIGSLLSGGVDSSLVTVFAARYLNRLDSFCAKFEHDTFDESKWAAKVARHIGTNHSEFTVTEKEASEMFPIMIHQYDEPYGDTSAIPTMLISKFASKHVSAVMLGDGGDELFLGYGTYSRAKLLNKPLISAFSPLFRVALSFGNKRMKRASHLFHKSSVLETRIFSQAAASFTHRELPKILNNSLSYNPWIPDFFPTGRIVTPAEHQAIFDLSYYMPDELLVKVDRAGALFGIDARSPFLDNAIIDFALNIDPKLKVKDGKRKYLLRKILDKYVPSELTTRRKHGFAIPLRTWMQGSMEEMFRHYLTPDTLNNYNIVNIDETQKLVDRFYNKKHNDLYVRLWLIASLHMWLEQSPLRR